MCKYAYKNYNVENMLENNQIYKPLIKNQINFQNKYNVLVMKLKDENVVSYCCVEYRKLIIHNQITPELYALKKTSREYLALSFKTYWRLH